MRCKILMYLTTFSVICIETFKNTFCAIRCKHSMKNVHTEKEFPGRMEFFLKMWLYPQNQFENGVQEKNLRVSKVVRFSEIIHHIAFIDKYPRQQGWKNNLHFRCFDFQPNSIHLQSFVISINSWTRIGYF